MALMLLYRWRLLPGMVLLLLLVGIARPAQATHLLGGELTYRYLDSNGPTAAPWRYEITVTVYNNCSNKFIRPAANVGIYDQATGARLLLTSTNYAYTTSSVSRQSGLMSIPETSISDCIAPAVPLGCTVSGVSQPYQLQKFVDIVNLPVSTQGYYALFTDGNRNVDITNLDKPDDHAMTLYTVLAPPKLRNHSPVFSDVAVALICANDTTFLLNNAVDVDGDRLVYSFGHPYGTTDDLGVVPELFTPPPPVVPYASGAGYSANTPFGTTPGNFASLESATGIAKYASSTVGNKYAVSVDVAEYRTIDGHEVLIGTTRRDLQLVVALCPQTIPPLLPPPTVTPRNYTIEAGSTLTVPITATQADGHPLTLTLNSELLDGAGGYNSELDGKHGTLLPHYPSGIASVSGNNGTVTGTFVFNSTCASARATPYDVAFTAKDNGCAGKTASDVLHITVTKPLGPSTISGDQRVCLLNPVHSYTASGGAAPGVSWRVVGGTIVGSSTANPVQVNWAQAGTGTIVARGVTKYGCLTDSVAQNVTITQPPTLGVSGNLRICTGNSTTLTVTGGTAPYIVTGGPTPLSGAGPFKVSPTQTTTYTITSTAAPGTCEASTQATVTVLPLPAANVGPATRSTCSGEGLTIGTAAVSGSTYSWSPATGLSSANSANPILTLTNTTGAAITQTYTLTETNATGCNSTGTVVVTVNAAVMPGTIGGSQMVCVGTTPTPLTSTAGAGGGTGTYTYQWESSLDNVTWSAIASATSASYSPGPVTATTYYRRQAISGTCAAVSNVVAVQLQSTVVTTVQLPSPALQCANSAITFSPVVTNAGATPTYRWFVNNTQVGTTPTYTSTTLVNGDQVRVELTPTAGLCTSGVAEATTIVSLTPVTLPTVAISLRTALPVCVGTTLTFGVDELTNPGPTLQYQWQIDGANVAGAQAATFSTNQLRDGQTVTLTVRSATVCGAVMATSNAVRATISPALVVKAGPDKTIMEGDQVKLEGEVNGNYTLVWTPAQTLTFTGNDLLHPVAAPLVTTTYTLSATVGSCSESSTVTVTVTPRLRIPNAFSPNGDGRDDTWEIEHIGDYSSNHILVFNRWGSKIFEASNYRRGNEWNGTISGQPAPVGTYYYIITLGNSKTYSGPLTVLY
jgi:gliding motility-associated-like protein